MELFIIIIVFLIVWFFTSTSKSEDVKNAIKFAKEAKNETDKFLDEVSNNLDEFNKGFEESVKKYAVESKDRLLKKQKEHLIWLSELEDIDEINKSLKDIGSRSKSIDDVTLIVNKFKESNRYEEISHLVIKESNQKSGLFSSNEDKYIINREYGELKRKRVTQEKLTQEKLTQEKLTQEKLTQEKLTQEKLT
ncbi:hypothetical protein R0J89_13450, partial [Psychrobacter sp. SIMBA_152]